jgi:hypothetical protein
LAERRPAAEKCQQHDDDHHVGERVKNINDAHHHVINTPAQVSGGRAVSDSYKQRDERGDDADHQRDSPADKNTRQNISA